MFSAVTKVLWSLPYLCSSGGSRFRSIKGRQVVLLEGVELVRQLRFLDLVYYRRRWIWPHGEFISLLNRSMFTLTDTRADEDCICCIIIILMKGVPSCCFSPLLWMLRRARVMYIHEEREEWKKVRHSGMIGFASAIECQEVLWKCRHEAVMWKSMRRCMC